MGNFHAISTITVDDANTAGEIRQVEKLALEYTSGQKCWNGPARSTTVVLECGEENEILKIMEDEKCIYSMHVTSPVACGEATKEKSKKVEKDEL